MPIQKLEPTKYTKLTVLNKTNTTTQIKQNTQIKYNTWLKLLKRLFKLKKYGNTHIGIIPYFLLRIFCPILFYMPKYMFNYYSAGKIIRSKRYIIR